MRGAEEQEATTTVPPPRANPDLVGHRAAERTLVRLYRAGRLPHAMLFAGPRGIGKATLAYRLARFVLAGGKPAPRPSPGSAAADTTLAVDPQSGVFRRVAASGHADLLTVERAWDPRRRRLRGEIVIDDVREIAGFLRLTAAEEGWRVVIVDGAEEMNRNAANAMLKVLEEPPARALLLLVSHNPGRLLPTIRSRCRRVALLPLAVSEAAALLRRYRPGLNEAEALALAAFAEGSVGRALELADGGGTELYRELVELLADAPTLNLGRLHALADRLARPDADDAYRVSEELLTRLLARIATAAAQRGDHGSDAEAVEKAMVARLARTARPERWAELYAELARRFDATRELNLDKKQSLLGAFFAIAELAR